MEPLAIGIALLLVVGAAVVGWVVGRRRGAPTRIDRPTADARSADAPTTDATAAELRRLEEYDFYPFTTDAAGHVHFDPDGFDAAVGHFLEERNPRAARELIVIGEQNLVRDTFPTDRLSRYKALYAAYDGDAVVSDNDEFLENYRRIVNQVGRSFPNTGMEILLHNLVNPSRSLVAIENAAVTGRSIGSGATNLVLDLKTRRQRGEDKVNYELNIGSRQFKCTTIPIFRADYGLVGAICINIDTRFMREYVMQSEERLNAFFDNLLRTDFQLGENILSKDEYTSALNGKRHFLDEAIRTGGGSQAGRRLAAIFFSDIVGYTTLMGADEARTMRIIATNEQIHRAALGRHRGQLIQELGDGMLARFDSASDAVAAAREVQRAVGEDGRYQVRVGIHLGEVTQDGGKVVGDGVNIAARIQAEMGPGEIGISSVVFDNVRNKEGVSATLLGERALKGVTDPVVLYSVVV
jgi:class 3 adenylate cyclase